MTRRWLLPLFALLATAACDRVGAAGARADTVTAIVDSAVPRPAALARFRAGLAVPDSLAAGADSREGLVREFVLAVERGDTAALRRLTLTRAEFAYLYYPTTPQAHAPYDLAPGLMWDMLVLQSGRGLVHLLEQRAGRPLGYAGHSCAPGRPEGENVLHGPCVVVRRVAAAGALGERLFGPIIERGGRFKFVSLANALD